MTETETKLLNFSANEEAGGRVIDISEIGLGCLASFGKYDGQSYVPESIRSLWSELSDEARLVAYLLAQQVAYLDAPPV